MFDTLTLHYKVYAKGMLVLATLGPHRNLVQWLLGAAAISIVFLTIEYASQHQLRITANDPQIQLAEDAAVSLPNAQAEVRALRGGAAPVDIARSLAPWIAVYSRDGLPLVSSAMLDENLPQLPRGTFDFAKEHGENRVTWQPRRGVRFAVVIRQMSSGEFVVSGRSLREIERRASDMLWHISSAWIFAMFAVAAAYLRGLKNAHCEA